MHISLFILNIDGASLPYLDGVKEFVILVTKCKTKIAQSFGFISPLSI